MRIAEIFKLGNCWSGWQGQHHHKHHWHHHHKHHWHHHHKHHWHQWSGWQHC